MRPHCRQFAALLLTFIAIESTATTWGAETLSPSQALTQGLTFSPVQAHLEYTIPNKDEAKQCTIQPEKESNGTAWVVRNSQGQVLRRFADTNNDNVVDLWCYYLDGVEVYRDIDSNFNKKADQYRWFNTAGTRWGIDRNEDGRIDSWRIISPHEVAEQVVIAIKTRDANRFSLLLATPNELNELGLGKPRAEQLTATIRTAAAQFGKLTTEQKLITGESRYVDFGSARPATIPSGTAGSTNDVTICDNATALVQTGGKHDQLYLGSLLKVGDSWKLIDSPSENQPQNAAVLIQPGGPAGNEAIAAAGPSAEMQKLLDELQQLDGEADRLSGDALARNIDERADRLEKLAEISTDKTLSEQFYNQLADMLGVAIQMKTYPDGETRMSDLEKKLANLGVDEQVTSHVAFQRMWAQYIVSQEKPGADQAQIQQQWLGDLQAFVEKYPKSNDASEALLQLGINQEFVGKTEEASKWYQQLARDFPNTAPGKKARGAIRRFNSVGTAMRLAGKDLRGGTVDISATPYRGKVVLIQYWATWSDNCKADMVLLKDLYAKKGGGRDFEILGVCLDSTAAPAQQYLAANRFPWNHVYESGGVDGRLADEMGVMTLPLMLLVDRDGRVVKTTSTSPNWMPSLLGYSRLRVSKQTRYVGARHARSRNCGRHTPRPGMRLTGEPHYHVQR